MTHAVRFASHSPYTPELRVRSGDVAAHIRPVAHNTRAPIEAPPVVQLDGMHGIHKTKAFLRIASMATPVGLVASAWVGPKITTTDQRQYSVPQLLANALVNKILPPDTHAQTPPLSNWSELAQRVFTKDMAIESAWLLAGVLATKGKNPGALQAIAKPKKAAKRPAGPSLDTQIRNTKNFLKDHQNLLAQTKNELSVYEKFPNQYGPEITKRTTWIKRLELEIATLEKQLKTLHNKQKRAANKAG